MYIRKRFSTNAVWSLEHSPQGNGHRHKPVRVQENLDDALSVEYSCKSRELHSLTVMGSFQCEIFSDSAIHAVFKDMNI